MNSLTRITLVSLILPVVILNTGCKSFVPSEPNSNKRAGEQVELRMLDKKFFEDVTNKEIQGFYFKAFPDQAPAGSKHPELAPVLLAPLAAAAVGAAFNFAATSISNQAALFQAQFGDTVYKEDFWDESGKQTYEGFELKRYVKPKQLAFDLICGMAPTADGQLMTVKPLYFVTQKAKAKVFSTRFLSGFGWLTELFSSTLESKGEINSTVDIKFTGYYKDKNQLLGVVPMAAFSLKFSGYSILNPQVLVAGGSGSNKIPEQCSGFLDTAPLSIDKDGKAVTGKRTGNFSLTVNVTEADASNARQDLEKIGQLISQEKSTIVVAVSNSISD